MRTEIMTLLISLRGSATREVDKRLLQIRRRRQVSRMRRKFKLSFDSHLHICLCCMIRHFSRLDYSS